MLDRFTDRARKVMSMAKQEALDLHTNKVGTEHLLLALAKEDEGIAAEALRSLDISYDDIMDTLKEVQTTVPEPSEETEAAKLAFTPLVISVMERSFRVARENNQTYVSTEHLLIGIVEEGNGMAMDILMRLGVSSASIKKAIEKLTAKDQDKKRPLAGAGAGRPGAGLPFFSGSDASQQKGSGTDTLKQFATNLTQKARDGELDPVIGREKEVCIFIRPGFKTETHCLIAQTVTIFQHQQFFPCQIGHRYAFAVRPRVIFIDSQQHWLIKQRHFNECFALFHQREDHAIEFAAVQLRQ